MPLISTTGKTHCEFCSRCMHCSIFQGLSISITSSEPLSLYGCITSQMRGSNTLQNTPTDQLEYNYFKCFLRKFHFILHEKNSQIWIKLLCSFLNFICFLKPKVNQHIYSFEGDIHTYNNITTTKKYQIK